MTVSGRVLLSHLPVSRFGFQPGPGWGGWLGSLTVSWSVELPSEDVGRERARWEVPIGNGQKMKQPSTPWALVTRSELHHLRLVDCDRHPSLSVSVVTRRIPGSVSF